MSLKGELAKTYFKEGYNCAQSIALAFCDEIGIEKTKLLRMVSSFGGGMGRLREVCGAVSGMFLWRGHCMVMTTRRICRRKRSIMPESRSLPHSFVPRQALSSAGSCLGWKEKTKAPYQVHGQRSIIKNALPGNDSDSGADYGSV